MNVQMNHEKELLRLCGLMVDGGLEDSDIKRLSELLSTDASAREFYRGYMDVHARILLHFEPVPVIDKPVEEPVRLHSDRELSTTRSSCWQELAADEAVEIFSDRVSDAGLHRRSKPRWLTWGSIAAGFAATLIFMWSYQPSTTSAASVLRQARFAAAEWVDRSYQVTMTKLVAGKDHPIVTEVELNVRGGGRFVVQPQSKRYVMGNDGADFWLILKKGPVWVTSDVRFLPREQMRKILNSPVVQLASGPNEPLLLELASILELMEENYNVELLESEDPELRYVQARRRAGRRSGPLTIDLWVDVHTGVTRRMELELVPFSDKILAKRVSLVLIESRVFSESWYGHAEHAAGREVSRVGAKTEMKNE